MGPAVSVTNGRKLVLGIVAGTVTAAAATAIIVARDPASSVREPQVPAHVRRAAVASFAEYGRVGRVIAETPATLHSHPGQDLWALLVEGDFEVVGPLTFGHGESTNTRGAATAGAAVVTDSGELVRIGAWGSNAGSNPVWERIFGDAYPIESD